jgi:hypothetical protein
MAALLAKLVVDRCLAHGPYSKDGTYRLVINMVWIPAPQAGPLFRDQCPEFVDSVLFELPLPDEPPFGVD